MGNAANQNWRKGATEQHFQTSPDAPASHIRGAVRQCPVSWFTTRSSCAESQGRDPGRTCEPVFGADHLAVGQSRYPKWNPFPHKPPTQPKGKTVITNNPTGSSRRTSMVPQGPPRNTPLDESLREGPPGSMNSRDLARELLDVQNKPGTNPTPICSY